jgi:hypothetical protein
MKRHSVRGKTVGGGEESDWVERFFSGTMFHLDATRITVGNSKINFRQSQFLK